MTYRNSFAWSYTHAFACMPFGMPFGMPSGVPYTLASDCAPFGMPYGMPFFYLNHCMAYVTPSEPTVK
jgi:hypothetical protein